MKRLFQCLAFAALLGFGLQAGTASASTITVKPNPTDGFKIFGDFDPPFPQTLVLFDDYYDFTLTKAADFSFTMQTVQNGTTAAPEVEDLSHHFVSPLNIQPGDYFVHVTILAFGDGETIYGGHVDFTAVPTVLAATPIPGSLLLLMTGLGGLGFAGFKRRARDAAA